MKYKAIVSALILGLLLLIPAGLIVTPTKAHQFVQPALSVFPPDTKFFGPCLVSTYFTIDVFLWNNPLSGVDVYAFDFVISWASISSISLVNATAHDPWANGFVIANGNATTPAGSDWHLAITNTGLGGLTDVNMSVLTLVFHIDTDVCWPNAVVGAFLLTGVKMSSDGSKPIPITNIEVDNGTYEQYSVQPDIELSTTDAAYNKTTNTITEKCNSHTFDMEVDLTDVTNVYGFEFYMTYNSSELETDQQHITFKAAFPPPYETLQVTLTPGTKGATLDQIFIKLVRPSEKPPVCGATVPAVDIVFHTNDTADGKGMIPTTSKSSISITYAEIYAKCPTPITYTSSATTTTWTTANSTWVSPAGLAWPSDIAMVTDNCSDLFLTVGANGNSFGYNATAAEVGVYDPLYGYWQYWMYNYDSYPTYAYYNGTNWLDATTLTGVGAFTVQYISIAGAPGEYVFDIPFANIGGYLGGEALTLFFEWYSGLTGYAYMSSPAATYVQQNLVTIGPPIKYYFKPSPYDLNLDCVVDVQDLQKLLPSYGKTGLPKGGYGDLWAPNGAVDIFDFVAIAKHFGTVDP